MTRTIDPAKTRVRHPFLPLSGPEGQILILGTMPSLRSRQNGFYYGHPQNRFWPLLAQLFQEAPPVTIEQKIQLVQRHRLILWDVLQECTIRGSSDASIKPVRLNPIDQLVKERPVKAIYANGQKAGLLYRQHLEKKTKIPITILPSTSPANARYSLADLARHWQVIRQG